MIKIKLASGDEEIWVNPKLVTGISRDEEDDVTILWFGCPKVEGGIRVAGTVQEVKCWLGYT